MPTIHSQTRNISNMDERKLLSKWKQQKEEFLTSEHEPRHNLQAGKLRELALNNYIGSLSTYGIFKGTLWNLNQNNYLSDCTYLN